MSVVGDALAVGLVALSGAIGASLQYRTGTSGGFTALTGWVLIQNRVDPIMFDESRAAEEQQRTASLKGPVSPLMVQGYQVQDITTGIIWAIQSAKLGPHQVCVLEYVSTTKRTPERHGAK